MKKIIPFTNDIKFNTKIYEITSISLEHNLKLKQNNIISGDFIISGDYKITDTSINTEPFINSIPCEITLDHKYDIDKLKIDIDDFNYEIENDEVLKVNISIKIDGIELVELEDEIKPDIVIEKAEKVKDTRNDFESIKQDLFKEESEIKEVSMVESDNASSTIDSIVNFSEMEDEYVTYYVHIVRENDNIEELCNKYNVTKENIKEYNNLDEFMVGSKIIIPYINESI